MSLQVSDANVINASNGQWPFYDSDEIQAVSKVLASGKVNYWTGSKGREFERAWAAKVGTEYGLAVMNGTVTMELALIALGIGPGDDVIITPRTFVATATAVMARGARPIFADVDRDSGNVTPETLEAVFTPQTKAVIPVHLGGWPCDMDGIMEWANARGVHVIEDCAQAHGAKWNGKSVGSFGVINSWSFCQDKIMTLGGEGGAITTNDLELWKVMWAYKDHGKNYDTVYHKQHKEGFRWLHEGPGTNWRMTELQAVIGLCQIGKLDAWVAKRRELAGILNDALGNVEGLRVPLAPEKVHHAYYRWYGFLDLEQLKDGWTRERVCARVEEKGFKCQVGSCSEIYLEKTFDAAYRPEKRLPVAKELGESSLVLFVHPTLSREMVEGAAQALIETLAEARR